MTGYVKLHEELLDSSVWTYSMEIRLVWITLLVMADQNGEVRSSVPGLAKRAGVPLNDTIEALKMFQEPDPYSMSKENEGRRISEINGGWELLNHAKYRAKRSAEDMAEQNRERQKRFRERKKTLRSSVTDALRVTGNNAVTPQAEEEADTNTEEEADADPKSTSTPSPSKSNIKDKGPLEPLDPNTIPLRGKGEPPSTATQIKRLIRQHWPMYPEAHAEATAMELSKLSTGLDLHPLVRDARLYWAPGRSTQSLHSYLCHWFVNASTPRQAHGGSGARGGVNPSHTIQHEGKSLQAVCLRVQNAIRYDEPITVGEIKATGDMDMGIGDLYNDLLLAGNQNRQSKYRPSEFRKPIVDLTAAEQKNLLSELAGKINVKKVGGEG